jgi:hypothetical protein
MSTFPPDFWNIESGTWGTDVDVDSTVAWGGGQSLKFLNTTPGSDPVVVSDFIPIEPGTAYFGGAMVMASRVNAGDTLGMSMREYDESFSLLGNNTFFSGVLSAADTWTRIGGGTGSTPTSSSARWGQLVLSKNNVAFNGWFAAVELDKSPPAVFAYRASSDQTIAGDGSFYPLIWTHQRMISECELDTSTGVVTLRRAGVYQFNLRVTISVLDASTNSLRLAYDIDEDGFGLTGTPIIVRNQGNAGGDNHTFGASWAIAVGQFGIPASGYKVATYISQNGGTDETTDRTASGLEVFRLR